MCLWCRDFGVRDEHLRAISEKLGDQLWSLELGDEDTGGLQLAALGRRALLIRRSCLNTPGPQPHTPSTAPP